MVSQQAGDVISSTWHRDRFRIVARVCLGIFARLIAVFFFLCASLHRLSPSTTPDIYACARFAAPRHRAAVARYRRRISRDHKTSMRHQNVHDAARRGAADVCCIYGCLFALPIAFIIWLRFFAVRHSPVFTSRHCLRRCRASAALNAIIACAGRRRSCCATSPSYSITWFYCFPPRCPAPERRKPAAASCGVNRSDESDDHDGFMRAPRVALRRVPPLRIFSVCGQDARFTRHICCVMLNRRAFCRAADTVRVRWADVLRRKKRNLWASLFNNCRVT